MGIDLSPAMVALARQRSPEAAFLRGDLRALPLGADVWAGLVAFYSIIHLPPEDLPRALREFARVLRPGGLLLVAFHRGRSSVHLDEWWGRPVALDFHFFEPEAIARQLQAAGLEVEARVERQPYVAVEHPSRRAYLLARKPRAGRP